LISPIAGACVAIFTAIAAPLAIGAGFSAGALLLLTAAAALLCGSTGTLLWRTKFAPARRREGRGLAILAIVLLIWSGLCSLGRMQRLALRAGASASQSLRNVLNFPMDDEFLMQEAIAQARAALALVRCRSAASSRTCPPQKSSAGATIDARLTVIPPPTPKCLPFARPL